MVSELPTLPEDLYSGLIILVDLLSKHQVEYALIGGLASGYRSRPRFTQDIDLVLDIPQLILPGLLDDLRREGFAFDVQTTIRQWNQEHMTVLTFRKVQVDWLKAVLPLYLNVIDTAEVVDWLGHPLSIATAESLIVTKLVAFRRQDQLDIANLLAANRDRLDLDAVRREFEAVSEADDPRAEQFEKLVREFFLD